MYFYKINGAFSPDPATGHPNVQAAGSYTADGYWQHEHGAISTSQ
jgi:hypothetical protein